MEDRTACGIHVAEGHLEPSTVLLNGEPGLIGLNEQSDTQVVGQNRLPNWHKCPNRDQKLVSDEVPEKPDTSMVVKDGSHLADPKPEQVAGENLTTLSRPVDHTECAKGPQNNWEKKPSSTRKPRSWKGIDFGRVLKSIIRFPLLRTLWDVIKFFVKFKVLLCILGIDASIIVGMNADHVEVPNPDVLNGFDLSFGNGHHEHLLTVNINSDQRKIIKCGNQDHKLQCELIGAMVRYRMWCPQGVETLRIADRHSNRYVDYIFDRNDISVPCSPHQVTDTNDILVPTCRTDNVALQLPDGSISRCSLPTEGGSTDQLQCELLLRGDDIFLKINQLENQTRLLVKGTFCQELYVSPLADIHNPTTGMADPGLDTVEGKRWRRYELPELNFQDFAIRKNILVGCLLIPLVVVTVVIICLCIKFCDLFRRKKVTKSLTKSLVYVI